MQMQLSTDLVQVIPDLWLGGIRILITKQCSHSAQLHPILQPFLLWLQSESHGH